MNMRIRISFFVLSVTLLNIVAVDPVWAALTHRYNFATNANDSVGMANWTVNGGATISGGQVNFDGVDDFLSRTSTILPTGGADSVTIEVWGTYNTATAVGSRIFDFSTVGGNAGYYTYLTPVSALNNTQWRFDNGFGEELGPIEVGATGDTGQEELYTLVFDTLTTDPNGEGVLHMYRNGAFVATSTAFDQEILTDLASATSIRLGHGTSVPGPGTMTVPPGTPPAFLTGSINEFRTYNHVMNATDILFSAVAGPDTTSVSFTDKTWNNTGTADWNTGTNWTGAGVPALANRAVLGNGGTATVTGTVPVTGTLRVTNGTISVGAGAVLESKFPIELQPGATGTATINVNAGGRLAISGILSDAGGSAKTINVNGGTIAAGFASALVTSGAALDGTGGLTLNVGANGMTFDTGGGQMIWSSAITGSGDIVKTGSGALALRAPASNLGVADQNPGFSGEFFVNDGTIDVRLDHGIFGTAGSTGRGSVHLNDSRVIIQTAYPAGGGLRKEFPPDLEVNGDNHIINLVDRIGTEIEMMGSLSGDGTLEFTKPNLADALGIDFENFALEGQADSLRRIDNSGFTGRIITNGNWAIRFTGAVFNPDGLPNTGDEVNYFDVDFPNAVLEMSNAGAWTGKRGTDPNQLIRLGGVAGVAGSRLQASIAGDGDVLADVTYHLGGADEDVEFFGNIIDNNATDTVTVVKVGSNTQALSGANTYTGTTTVNGGTLLVNGTHQQDLAISTTPVSDYTVNSGGTLGGIGTIGSAADPVNVNVVGGAIAPGTSVGTLSLNGDAVFGADADFNIEIDGAMADRLAVTGNLNLSALGNALNVTGTGSGSWVIATYTGTLAGTFESVTSGLSVNYGTGSNSQITISGSLSAALIGDYNNNGTVDAADYAVYRNSVGGDGSLLGPNRDPANNGVVGPGDYNSWRAHFGQSQSGAGSGGISAVPEPASWLLVAAAVLAGLVRRRSR